MLREYIKPEQDALTSKAAAFLAPIFFCTRQAVDGMNMSGDVVDSTISPTSSTATPADFSADKAALVARSEVASSLSALRRSIIPVFFLMS